MIAAVNLWRDTLPWVGGGFALVFLLTWAWLWIRTTRDRSPRARDVLDTWARWSGMPQPKDPPSRRLIVTGDIPYRVLHGRDQARQAWPWGREDDAL